MKKKVQILIDSSHEHWILGGLFRDVYNSNREFYSQPLKIYNFKTIKFLNSLVLVFIHTIKKSTMIFSSITPLENFLRINHFHSSSKILWYTHHENVPDKKTISMLNKTDLIFVHSNNLKNELIRLGVCVKIVVVTGAINPNCFKVKPSPGKKLAWIGTPAPRKNPEMLLSIAEKYEDMHIKIIGRGWKHKPIYEKIKKIKNIEYSEMKSQLYSTDLDDCSHFLMLSTAEGGPISLLETLASGLIPISTSVGIAPELLPKIGYSQQLLKVDYTVEDIRQKYKNRFSRSQIENASRYIERFSIDNLSLLIQKEIESLL